MRRYEEVKHYRRYGRGETTMVATPIMFNPRIEKLGMLNNYEDDDQYTCDFYTCDCH